jgi:hypothetical protein
MERRASRSANDVTVGLVRVPPTLGINYHGTTEDPQCPQPRISEHQVSWFGVRTTFHFPSMVWMDVTFNVTPSMTPAVSHAEPAATLESGTSSCPSPRIQALSPQSGRMSPRVRIARIAAVRRSVWGVHPALSPAARFRLAGCVTPTGWSSTAGRPKAGTAGPRSRSWPTTSEPASGRHGRGPESRATTVRTTPSTRW